MARINVEEDFWTDPRREALGLFVGDQEKADGRMLRAWRLSQSYWKKGQCIPEDIWEAARLNGILECGLAERQDGGIYCRGSAFQFKWIRQHVVAGRVGGKASVAARKERFGTAIPPNATNTPLTEAPPKLSFEKTEAPSEAGPNPHTHTLISSISPRRVNPPNGGHPPLVMEWSEWAKTRLKSLRPNLAKWADTYRKLLEIDGLTEEEVRAIFEFVKGDEEFWAKNAISLEGLRSKSKNGLRKFENIQGAMKDRPSAYDPDAWLNFLTPEERARALGTK